MKRYLTSIALLILLLISLLISCKSQTGPEPTESPIKPTAGASSTNLTGEEPPSPLPTPAPEIVPGPDTGIVMGTLEQTASSPLPLEERMLYLSSIIHGAGRPDFEVAKMDPVRDPRSAVNADGSFIFTDIQPGKYALSTVTPRGESVLLLHLDTGLDIVIEVEAGKITDLGVILVNFGF